MPRDRAIPTIDLFAGPGGLGEGFASLDRTGVSPTGVRFECRLSIEKDQLAHRTLELRAFFRQFPPGHAPADYYDYLRRRLTRDELFARHPAAAAAAAAEAWCAELGGPAPGHAAVRARIAAALGGADDAVLLGGPPCQAYSI